MDFTLPPELRDLRAQVRALVDDHIIPAEADLVREDSEGKDDTLRRLRGLVRDAGLWTPHLPVEHVAAVTERQVEEIGTGWPVGCLRPRDVLGEVLPQHGKPDPDRTVGSDARRG